MLLEQAEQSFSGTGICCTKAVHFPFDELGLQTGRFTNFWRENANAICRIGQSVARIVLPKNEPAFSPRREHSIGLVRSLSHQIVN